MKAAELQGFRELRPITSFAAFNLGQFGDQMPIAAIEVITDGAVGDTPRSREGVAEKERAMIATG